VPRFGLLTIESWPLDVDMSLFSDGARSAPRDNSQHVSAAPRSGGFPVRQKCTFCGTIPVVGCPLWCADNQFVIRRIKRVPDVSNRLMIRGGIGHILQGRCDHRRREMPLRFRRPPTVFPPFRVMLFKKIPLCGFIMNLCWKYNPTLDLWSRRGILDASNMF